MKLKIYNLFRQILYINTNEKYNLCCSIRK